MAEERTYEFGLRRSALLAFGADEGEASGKNIGHTLDELRSFGLSHGLQVLLEMLPAEEFGLCLEVLHAVLDRIERRRRRRRSLEVKVEVGDVLSSVVRHPFLLLVLVVLDSSLPGGRGLRRVEPGLPSGVNFLPGSVELRLPLSLELGRHRPGKVGVEAFVEVLGVVATFLDRRRTRNRRWRRRGDASAGARGGL